MLNKYSEILSAMQYEHNQLPSEKYLLVDGLNLFIRAFAANPTINADGIHIGGISGSLGSLGSAIKQFNPTRVIIVVDGKGGSVRRKKIFPDYKANRKKKKKTYKYNRSYEGYGPDLEKQMMKLQLSRLFEYFEHMPITIIMIDYVEADDIIAHIATTYNNVQHVIMSADKDFLQLCTTDNIKVWAPTKKKLYTKDNVTTVYDVPVNNLALFRAIDGDPSDGIPGIPGWGKKTILKKLQVLQDSTHIYNLEELIDYAEKYNIPKLIENKKLVERNYKLMQLSNVDISESIKTIVKEKINEKIPRLAKYKIQVMILEDKLFTAIKNSTVWLSKVFNFLDMEASKFNKKNKKD